MLETKEMYNCNCISKELRIEFTETEISNINILKEEGVSLGELGKLCHRSELITGTNE